MSDERPKRRIRNLSPQAAAAVLNKPTRHVWYDIQNRADDRIRRVVYDPSGRTEIEVDVEDALPSERA